MPSKILVVDDHQLVLDGLSSIVKDLDDFEILAAAHNGKEALDITKALKPDIILMDIDMPVMNGLEAMRRIKEENPKQAVIMLTMHNEASLIKKVMDIGADGYVLKNADRTEFYSALCAVSKGKSYFSSEVTQALLNPEKNGATAFNVSPDTIQLSKLTEREIDVLKLIAEGLSNKEIGEKLYISHRTVDTHRTNLMKKLDAHNIAGLIKFAIKNGMVN
ncbi:MAG: response regulator transcription factor [Vicingaceae bacterium]